MKLQVCIALLLSLSAVLFATAEQYGDFTYVVTNSTAEITSYSGLGGAVAIPGNISGMTVTIGANAFRFCGTLIQVTISNGVTRIGERAFDECTGLVNVTIPASVNDINPKRVFGGCDSLTNIAVDGANGYYSSTNGILFNKDKTWLIQCPGGMPGDYTVPVGVTNINGAAFRYCKILTSVTIPEGVLEISGTTFFGCFNLAAVSIPNSVTAIRSSAFQACRSLTNVTLSANVNIVEPAAFADCDSLPNIAVDGANACYSSTNGVLFNKDKTWLVQCPGGMLGGYTIQAGVSGIGDNAFSGCAKLTALTIPSSVTTIGRNAFSSCTELTGVYFQGNAPSLGSSVFTGSPATVYYFPETTGWGATLGDRPTVPLGYAYTNNGNGTSTITGYTGNGGDVRIPDTISNLTVTSIGSSAFSSCDSLTNVTIGTNVTSIGVGVFGWCYSLTNVTLPGSLSSIGDRAFFFCTNLTSITIPDSVNSIGGGAFAGCSRQTAITVGAGNTVYSSLDGVLFNSNRTTLIRCPGGKTGVYTIPPSVTNIEENASDGCPNLTCVIIGNLVTSIGRHAFVDCGSLTNIAVDAGNPVFSSFGGVLFNKNQTALIQYPGGQAPIYTIPSSVTSIVESAFYCCRSLSNVTIPATVSSIEQPFGECTSLTNIAVDAGNPVFSSFGGVLFNKNQTTLIVCPPGKAGRYTVPDAVTLIGNSAFYRCYNLTGVTFPNSLSRIEGRGFYACINLTDVYFRGNAPSLGDSDVFTYDNNATLYYLSGATNGWASTFSSRPAKLWNPTFSAAGLIAGAVSCTVTGTPSIPIAVDTCTNLLNDSWTRLQTTNIPSAGSYDFHDSDSTNHPVRYYRIIGPTS